MAKTEKIKKRLKKVKLPMTTITREKIMAIAHQSQLEVVDSEIDQLTRKIQEVLAYTERVKDIKTDTQITAAKNINVFRPDTIIVSDAQRLLQEAPAREGDFFVVPMILDNN